MNDRVIDAERLTGRVHSALIEDLALVQKRLARLVAHRSLFGKDALPTNSVGRSSRDILTNAEDYCKREETRLWERYHELTQTIKALEDILQKAQEADMQAFAEFWTERVKEERAAWKRQHAERNN